MNPDQIEAARRLMGSPNWKRRPIALAQATHRDSAGIHWLDVAPDDGDARDLLPDLDDPATVGVLIHVVCSLYDRHVVHVSCPTLQVPARVEGPTADYAGPLWRVLVDAIVGAQ